MLSFFRRRAAGTSAVQKISQLRTRFSALSDVELRAAARQATELPAFIAVTATVAARMVGLDMFDVQIQGALALAAGRIAEMQTGEGKTLAAVPAIAWLARQGRGVHVMTVNDYLARRDARWMGPIYAFLGLSVGVIQQGLSAADRRAAYACDVTYSTANEIGFDFLRDQLALELSEQVHRPFAAALIDEADSILIDEARIPLVVAGGNETDELLAHVVDQLVRRFHPWQHFTIDQYARNIALTDAGIRAVEHSFGCSNLFDDENLRLLSAVQDSLHAHFLLRRDVDYLVKNGAIESVDEFKGRIAQDRRWPAGLHTALEAKEGVAAKPQGTILGSITIQNLIALYPQICGMTGTAATQAEEFRKIYSLDVEVIPTHKPVIRVDHPDAAFRTKADKERALVEEIRRIHGIGQPILIGTASVEESERLSGLLGNIAHQVLNARNDEAEAAIIARAGQRGAVTVSTNMAGRGTDIQLGPGVAEFGGLYVIGTNKHESRRIDNQLRGRAGRQGDPGASRFFISLQDDLMVKYGGEDPGHVQRQVEGANLDIRQFLHKYEGVIEGQRQKLQQYRQSVLTGDTPCSSELERVVTLRAIDDLWSDHLAQVADFRSGVQWISWGGRDPLHAYLQQVHAWFDELEASLPEEIARRLAAADSGGLDPRQRSAVWTYLTTDQPFGTFTERLLKGLRRKAKRG